MNAREPVSTLTYPFGKGPEPGGVMQVADGVLWLRMPLPVRLGHINLWVLEDGEGWTVVDTGLNTPDSAKVWQATLDGPLRGKPVRRVICTHMHADHIGMAGWLAERFGCPLLVTRLEYLTCRTLVADTGRNAPDAGLRFYRAAGWSPEALELYRKRFGAFGSFIHRLPDSFERIADGDAITIGGRRWHVIVGRGHSPEHACLYCAELGLMISGDQVLPRISSNVSVFPMEPAADPLADWLESLESLRVRIPDSVLVLPAHNEPFRGLHQRLSTLIEGHRTDLDKLRAALTKSRRAVDTFEALFDRQVSGDQLIMATGESLAHLNWLIARGMAVREPDTQGVNWYRVSTTGP